MLLCGVWSWVKENNCICRLVPPKLVYSSEWKLKLYTAKTEDTGNSRQVRGWITPEMTRQNPCVGEHLFLVISLPLVLPLDFGTCMHTMNAIASTCHFSFAHFHVLPLCWTFGVMLLMLKDFSILKWCFRCLPKASLKMELQVKKICISENIIFFHRERLRMQSNVSQKQSLCSDRNQGQVHRLNMFKTFYAVRRWHRTKTNKQNYY